MVGARRIDLSHMSIPLIHQQKNSMQFIRINRSETNTVNLKLVLALRTPNQSSQSHLG